MSNHPMKLGIGILSCAKYADRQQACRETWMGNASTADIRCRFFVGRDANPQPDTIRVECGDDYWAMVCKVRAMFQHALDNGYDYLFKCDDDTFVHVERLVGLVESGEVGDYRGYDIGESQNMLSYASGGAGYLVSRRAMETVLASKFEPFTYTEKNEDVYVGIALREADIHVVHDRRFRPNAKTTPSHCNDIITGHYVTPERMRELHRELYGN